MTETEKALIENINNLEQILSEYRHRYISAKQEIENIKKAEVQKVEIDDDFELRIQRQALTITEYQEKIQELELANMNLRDKIDKAGNNKEIRVVIGMDDVGFTMEILDNSRYLKLVMVNYSKQKRRESYIYLEEFLKSCRFM